MFQTAVLEMVTYTSTKGGDFTGALGRNQVNLENFGYFLSEKRGRAYSAHSERMEIMGLSYIAQPLLQAIMPISDPLEDDSKRSEGFVDLFCFVLFL